jgi:HAD superfamily hydrolase (TIGR01509 family)
MTGPDHVIFDCDGVLVDSELIVNRVLARLLTAEGLPCTAEDCFREYTGNAWPASEARIAARLGRPLPDGFLERFWGEAVARMEAELAPVPGIEAALDEIALPWAVASNSSTDGVRRSLVRTGLLHRFDGRIFGADLVERPKPHPAVYLHAAAAMGFDPARCVVVEDSPVGVRAARAAGMARVLGYAARTDPDRLAAEGAEPFESMDELPALLTAG